MHWTVQPDSTIPAKGRYLFHGPCNPVCSQHTYLGTMRYCRDVLTDWLMD